MKLMYSSLNRLSPYYFVFTNNLIEFSFDTQLSTTLIFLNFAQEEKGKYDITEVKFNTISFP